MNFTDITHLVEPNKKLSFFNLLGIDDKIVYEFDKKRYRFYIKLLAAMHDPETLKKVLYKYTELKMDRDNENEVIDKIVEGIKNVSPFYDDSKIASLVKNIRMSLSGKIGTNEDANGLIDDELKKILTQKGGLKDANGKEIPETQGTKDKDIDKTKTPATPATEQQLKERSGVIIKDGAINVDILDKYDKPLEKFNTSIEKAVNGKDVGELSYEDLKKVKQIINSSKTNPIYSSVEISYSDRIIFIIITFLIRIISLLLIEWSINAGIINSFASAFIYYCIIYLLLFLFVVMVVNVSYYYPAVQLYTDNNIASIPAFFYYFYIYTNGYSRLIAHVFIILILLFIPFILKEDLNDNNELIRNNYLKKNKINNTLSKFTLMIFILTSIIASKF